MRIRQDDGTSGGYDSSLFGGGGAGELSIGGTPARGLVVAATMLGWSLVNPSFSSSSASASATQTVSFGVLGVTLDWYPRPRDGFHLGGTLGVAAKTAYDDTGAHVHGTARAGGALALSTGYDWWIAPEWSLGFLARVVGADLANTESLPSGSRSVTDRGAAFAMLFTGTYH